MTGLFRQSVYATPFQRASTFLTAEALFTQKGRRGIDCFGFSVSTGTSSQFTGSFDQLRHFAIPQKYILNTMTAKTRVTIATRVFASCGL